ncbi:MAG: type II 3-dehydroquinate dehydratase [Burkholderiaceae bacterium]|nr:type II 3-dehydroquinate dehydratase [Burkholderiaceae bacterium]
MARSVLVVNGPNLNLLGTREPSVYGTQTLADIERDLGRHAAVLGVSVRTFQSNHEGELITRVQQARGDGTDFIIVNAGGFTHSSVALRDALASVAIPFIEVHISNLHKRERFRHRSLLADLAVGSIVGLGVAGYRLALEFAAGYGEAQPTPAA